MLLYFCLARNGVANFSRLSAIYLFSYIDRGNIGNAKTAGMTKELGINSSQYGWLVSMYYIAYICFHWVSLQHESAATFH